MKNFISLDYIGASKLIKSIANCTNRGELKTVISDLLCNDLIKAQGYIDKYDNPIDRLEVDLSQLKEELESVKSVLDSLE